MVAALPFRRYRISLWHRVFGSRRLDSPAHLAAVGGADGGYGGICAGGGVFP